MGMIADLWAKLSLKPDKKSWDDGNKMIGGLKTAVAAVFTFESVKAVAGWVKSVADVGDHADEAAQKLGITAEAVQELGYAASFSSISQEGLEAALGKLAINLDEVATKGKGPAADALRRLGVSMNDLKGETLDQNLEVIAERFSKMPDGITKTALAVDLFGKSGKELIPFLNEGQEGIVRLRNEAEELGLVIDGETTKSLAEFNDEQEKLGHTLTGLKNQVVIALLPAIRSIIDGLRSWVEENRELIKSALAGAVTVVVKAVQALAFVITKFLLPAFAFLAEHGELVQDVLIAIGAFLLPAAAAWAAAMIVAAAPFIAIVTILTGIVIAIRHVITHWQAFKEIAAMAAQRVADSFEALWEGLKSIGSSIAEFFTETIPNAIADSFEALWEKIKQGARDTVNWLRNLPVIKQAIDLGEAAAGVVGDVKDLITGNQAPVNQETADQMGRLFGPEFGGIAQREVDNSKQTQVQVQMGDINVQAPEGKDPADFAEQVRGHFGDMFNEEIAKAL